MSELCKTPLSISNQSSGSYQSTIIVTNQTTKTHTVVPAGKDASVSISPGVKYVVSYILPQGQPYEMTQTISVDNCSYISLGVNLTNDNVKYYVNEYEKLQSLTSLNPNQITQDPKSQVVIPRPPIDATIPTLYHMVNQKLDPTPPTIQTKHRIDFDPQAANSEFVAVNQQPSAHIEPPKIAPQELELRKIPYIGL